LLQCSSSACSPSGSTSFGWIGSFFCK
jgi:hypothetical protein